MFFIYIFRVTPGGYIRPEWRHVHVAPGEPNQVKSVSGPVIWGVLGIWSHRQKFTVSDLFKRILHMNMNNHRIIAVFYFKKR